MTPVGRSQPLPPVPPPNPWVLPPTPPRPSPCCGRWPDNPHPTAWGSAAPGDDKDAPCPSRRQVVVNKPDGTMGAGGQRVRGEHLCLRWWLTPPTHTHAHSPLCNTVMEGLGQVCVAVTLSGEDFLFFIFAYFCDLGDASESRSRARNGSWRHVIMRSFGEVLTAEEIPDGTQNGGHHRRL